MFRNAVQKVLKDLNGMIKKISRKMLVLETDIASSLQAVFSIFWDSQDESKRFSTALLQKMRECRDNMLPEINRLLALQNDTSKLLGIEREEQDLELMEVDSLDQRLSKRLAEAQERGDAFDLCDSDVELDVKPKPKVKKEGQPSTSRKVTISGGITTIDLCDSDSDDDMIEPPPTAHRVASGVKSESDMI